MSQPFTAEMAAALKIGQVLKGRLGQYTITKELQNTVWVALNQNKENVIVKSVRHWRLQNERDMLKRFQQRTSSIRPLVDEIEEPTDPPAIVLKYLEDDALQASNAKRFTRTEVKCVAKSVLEALRLLHAEGLVHTDVKPSNVLVNYTNGDGNHRFKDVQLADLENTVHVDSIWAKNGYAIGVPIFCGPEVLLSLPWNCSADIWAFGAMVISLLYGEKFHVFIPDVPVGHDDYEIGVLFNHHRIFGPFPPSYDDIADDQRKLVILYLMHGSPTESFTLFRHVSETEVCKEDRDFILKIMKLDPRDRPSAQQLLEDEWFREQESRQIEDVQCIVDSDDVHGTKEHALMAS